MRARRGFVILIVLVMLAILSAAVVAQFASAGNNEIISVRSADDAKARALAESCLTLLQEYAEDFIGAPPAGDFDRLLNPDGVAAFSAAAATYEYLPTPLAGEVPVVIPKGLADADTVPRHRWLLVPKTVGTERGACLLRFDDNADESVAVTNLPSGIVDVAGEGPAVGSEVTYLDRDRSIYLSAIGIFPYLAGTAAADAYSRAHARVTLRRLFNAGGAAVAGGVAILAFGHISGIKGKVCGGGLSGNGYTPKGSPIRGSGCGCGPLTFPSSPSAPPQCTLAQCPNGCSGVSTPTGSVTVATINAALLAETVPGSWAPFGVLDIKNFGPSAPPKVLPAPAPIDLGLDDLGGGKASCKFFYENGGKVYVWDRLDAATVATGADCRSYTTDPVERPCTWAAGVATCVGAQTECWKPVHEVPGTFRPLASAVIPNVANAKNWGAVVGSANYLCGDATPVLPALGACSSCDGVANDAGTWTAPGWNFTEVDNTDLPVPAYIVVENANTAAVTVLDGPGGSGAPLNATFAVNGPVTLQGAAAALCGASCDCSPFGGTAAIVGACDAATHGPVPPATQSCIAVRTGQRYQVDAGTNNFGVVGAVRAGTVHDNAGGAGGCYVGGVAAMGGGSPSCGASYCDPTNFLCWSGASNVVGDMYTTGSAIINGNNELYGTLSSEGDFCANSGVNEQVFGNMIVRGDVRSKGNFRVEYTGGAGATSAIFSLKSMMETAW